MRTFEELVKSNMAWDDSDFSQDQRTFANLKHLIHEYVIEASGDEEAAKQGMEDWGAMFESAFKSGCSIQRVVFLDDIDSLQVDKFDASTPWTTLDVVDSGLMEELLYDHTNHTEKANENSKAYIFKAQCPANNIHIDGVPLPHHYSEMEVNISDISKLSKIEVYEYMGATKDLKLVGFMDLKAQTTTFFDVGTSTYDLRLSTFDEKLEHQLEQLSQGESSKDLKIGTGITPRKL